MWRRAVIAHKRTTLPRHRVAEDGAAGAGVAWCGYRPARGWDMADGALSIYLLPPCQRCQDAYRRAQQRLASQEAPP